MSEGQLCAVVIIGAVVIDYCSARFLTSEPPQFTFAPPTPFYYKLHLTEVTKDPSGVNKEMV